MNCKIIFVIFTAVLLVLLIILLVLLVLLINNLLQSYFKILVIASKKTIISI